MKFQVNYKGSHPFIGPLAKATAYLEKQWGSVEKAYEMGVKLVLVPA